VLVVVVSDKKEKRERESFSKTTNE
jgi:hypothetical protein